MAQSIWEKAGRAERYDLDELYGMVWPTGDIAMIPPSEIEERSNTRSKLDDLLSRTMDINKVMDELSMMIQKPAITARVNRVAVRLVRAIHHPLVVSKTIHALSFPGTLLLGRRHRHR